MIHMTNEFFLDLGAVLALGSHVSLAVLVVLDASVAEAAADADAVAEVAGAAAAADVDAADVNQLLEYSVQKDPCMSLCRGFYYYKKV
jgi:hypothetical protein